MRASGNFKFGLGVFMAFVMGSVPALAGANGGMIATNVVVAELSRTSMEQEVMTAVKHDEVKSALLKNGITADEISQRLASLSDQELRALSGQIQEARAGGDILVTILVVVLIIFLVRRI